MEYYYPNELYHYGIKGMKWGVRRTPEQLGYNQSDSAVTKRVKKDYNSMSDQDFIRKYQVSKKTYANRVARYGDPYTNGPAANLRTKTKGSIKSMRKEREAVSSKEYKKLVKEYGINQKKKDAIAYAEKHKLDYDGGGGNTKAGRKYLGMWDEINSLETKARMEASKRATDRLIDKYGEQSVKSLNRSDKIREKAAIAGIMAVPIAALAYTMSLT